MKCFPFFLFIEVIVLAVCVSVFVGCGNDDETDDIGKDSNPITVDASSRDNVNIVGTWKLVAFEPQVPGASALPEQTFTLEADGTWSVTTVSEVPVLGQFTVTAQGTYKISGNKITGETTDIEIEPDFNTWLSVPSGITGESTVKRDENRLTITSRDEATGRTTTTVYEKQ